MTDETQEPTDAESGSGIGNELSSTVAKLGASEKLAVLGAAGVMVVWLLFDLLIDEYGIGEPSFILAGLVVGAAYFHHNRGSADWSVDYISIVKVAGIFLGLLGAWTLVEQLRADLFDRDATSIIGALGYYIGCITSGIGAWQLKRS